MGYRYLYSTLQMSDTVSGRLDCFSRLFCSFLDIKLLIQASNRHFDILNSRNIDFYSIFVNVICW